MIFDTDVIIWYLRNNEKAVETVVNAAPFSISIITYMELLQGMKNKQETDKLKKSLKAMEIKVLPINEDISIRASGYVEQFALSDSMQLADALIASTCVYYGEMLCTANDKHYKRITDLLLKVFRP